MKTILRIARKEFASFFSSPIAFIFLGAFLAVTLFIFFWVETFFARNIADVRALFQWMPILLIFLTAAITMRLWAEEHRAGTLEFLLTAPVRPFDLVAGKFLACLGLIAVALVLTLPLPITVSFLGPLDWGPVFGGYLATFFLAAAYISIGLYVSVKSENQIVSLIATTLICGLFYLIGSETLISFFGNRGSELLQLLGSGSRFQSITRGVVDLRDLYYYLCIVGIFLCLNVYGLEKIRWAGNRATARHRRWGVLCGLLVANFLAANFWLAPIGSVRIDLTQGHIYSISDTTRSYLRQLKEPLLLRGYFSPKTHPLLAPLVPQLRDLLKEYAVAGGSNVHVEFVNPEDNPKMAEEAGQKYGIKPIPFQTASKYQTSVTNSYFDVLIKYGDQFQTLGFRDLIEVKALNSQQLAVDLRNPEYDITRAIKKVLYSYQAGGNLFANIKKPVTFTGYISADNQLPKQLVELKGDLNGILAGLKKQGGADFSMQFVDPESNGGAIAKKIEETYGYRPMAASLFSQNRFWFYMVMKSGDQVVDVPLPEDLTQASLKRAVNSGLKRFAAGFTKTIALSTPPGTPPMPQYGIPGSGERFETLKQMLQKEHIVTDTDLKKGYVPANADLLMVVAPKSFDTKQLYAMDQFLMQGGTVILATSPYDINLRGGLSMDKQQSGIADWLKFNGINIDPEMVLDPQNSAFPVPAERNVGGFTIQETHMVRYPFFVDIRPDGMNQNSGVMTGLNQVTMNWASPIHIDAKKNKDRKVVRLLQSSTGSWSASGTNIQPNFSMYPEFGFPVGHPKGRKILGAMVTGRFTSYFAGKPSPLLAENTPAKKDADKPENGAKKDQEKDKTQVISRQLDKSPDTARIIVFSSNSFLSDTMLRIGSEVMRTNYINPVQMMSNAADWSVEDRGLLAIRSRGHFSRTLYPMTLSMEMFWEYLNYGLALLGLLLVWTLKSIFSKRSQQCDLALIQQSLGRI
jgi:ABC-2 type transport system permease protein